MPACSPTPMPPGRRRSTRSGTPRPHFCWKWTGTFPRWAFPAGQRRGEALPPRWQCSCWGTLMARAMVLPVWKPPLTNCSPAAGRGIPCSAPSTPRESCGPSQLSPADSGAVGVQLTLSREIQQTAEAVANKTMQSGCILVLDTANAKVRACVSRPGYDPENISASLNAPDSPLLERAFQCYAVGSVFKPVVAAAALEAGESSFVYTCPGWCAVDGRIFRCAGGIPHGEVDLAGALEKSCNGYFIRLGQALGADAVRAMAEQLGFGQTIPLTDALHTAAGVLPEREALASSGAYANFCFGQGELLASPLQVAAMMNTIACGGICRTPLLLETTLDETTGTPLTALSHVRSRRVLTKRTAAALQALLAGVVAGGTGHEAALPGQTAAGKTGTAQTGQFSGGTELKNYWFAGFVPAEQPRYTIVVLQDTQAEPAFSSAAIFARVAAGLEILAP
jgi:cell division protein FtsI/penicillin-binding protein 2